MMEINEIKAIIEAMLFSAGREVSSKEIMAILELNEQDLEKIVQSMKDDFVAQNRGIEIIKVDENYQMCTKKEYSQYIYPLFDNRAKPTLSNAAMETLSIIAYNPKITRAEIEAIRGVNTDGTIYKLLEYNLIEEAGKMDAPGRPTLYKTTQNFLKTFGLSTLEELPDLPRYKLDENEQIVLDDFTESVSSETSANETTIEEIQEVEEKNIWNIEQKIVEN